MDEYEKIRQRKREEYRKRHRAQVRRKQLINNGIVIGMKKKKKGKAGRSKGRGDQYSLQSYTAKA